MDIKCFYSEIGGNYDDALTRLMNDELIKRFILKFKDSNYLDDLKESISSGDFDKIFFSVHTLKGVSLNLSFSKLGEECIKLTEYLRGENKNRAEMPKIVELFKKINDEYKKVLIFIDEFIEK